LPCWWAAPELSRTRIDERRGSGTSLNVTVTSDGDVLRTAPLSGTDEIRRACADAPVADPRTATDATATKTSPARRAAFSG
jgi:hypothetical protein